jgi:hypothetical protein
MYLHIKIPLYSSIARQKRLIYFRIKRETMAHNFLPNILQRHAQQLWCRSTRFKIWVKDYRDMHQINEQFTEVLTELLCCLVISRIEELRCFSDRTDKWLQYSWSRLARWDLGFGWPNWKFKIGDHGGAARGWRWTSGSVVLSNSGDANPVISLSHDASLERPPR